MSKVPKKKNKIDWSNVISLVEDHMDLVFTKGQYPRSDADHYIFEAVLEAAYGDGVWNEYNEQEID